ncbi:periplasmic chaperone for outer membrane proteins SurA [Chitinophaga skermanii]|uniref:Periplasmic chaperone for outer membrane proteins SurA n=2 Tax=Chitinophaga skermanii TaxID=331697 RepID=A0A327QCK8_9BACT|nr:periplasmic chaperone for outer membrane proteins SurA [Chitinophaga skermanii]
MLSAAAWLFCTNVFAQQYPIVADKIVAKVNDKIILRSDVESQAVELQRNMPDGKMPHDAFCQSIEQMIAQKVLVLQAERDSLPVSEADVDGQIENRVRHILGLYGGDRQKMEEITGYTIYQMRERFREPIREAILAKSMRDKVFGTVKVTPTEVRANHDAIPKDSLPFYESELEIGQIVIFPKASKEMENYAIERLTEFKKSVENKEKDFTTLANLYSEDPGVKENGGIYTINRNEKANFDPDFVAGAFRLKEGEISSPVKSQFGYHLIKMLRRQGDNVVVQHILLKANITKNDMTSITSKLDSIRTLIIDKKINFAEAVAKYSDAQMAKFDGGMLQNPMNGSSLITIDQLDQPSEKEIVLMIDTMKVGDISKPSLFEDEQGRKGLRIVYLKTRTEPHRENMQDDYARIQQRTLVDKQYDALQKWLVTKIPTFYIHVEDEYKNCGKISAWMAATAKQ